MSSEDKTGGYFWGTGRRKCAKASVRLRPGTGHFVINDTPIAKYFGTENLRTSMVSALKFTKLATAFDVFATVEGGGPTGQAEATTRLMFQLELVGLSRLGSSPLRALKDNIPGYRLLREIRGVVASPESQEPFSSSDD